MVAFAVMLSHLLYCKITAFGTKKDVRLCLHTWDQVYGVETHQSHPHLFIVIEINLKLSAVVSLTMDKMLHCRRFKWQKFGIF